MDWQDSKRAKCPTLTLFSYCLMACVIYHRSARKERYWFFCVDAGKRRHTGSVRGVEIRGPGSTMKVQECSFVFGRNRTDNVRVFSLNVTGNILRKLFKFRKMWHCWKSLLYQSVFDVFSTVRSRRSRK